MLWLLLACSPGAAPDLTDTTDRFFEVPAGATARGLGGALEKDGLVVSASDWTMFLRMGADGSCIKAGRHKVKRSMNATELLSALCGAPVPKDEPFTVVEGWRIRDIDEELTKKGWITDGAYIAEAAKVDSFIIPFKTANLEGYLYPDTYRVEPDRFTAHDMIQRQLDTFVSRFWNENKDKLGKRTLQDIVVMASLVEKEEPTPSNRPLIAGILWKRLDNDWNLGVDATSRYTLADWNDRDAFMKKLRDPSDPWNTRLKGGLPPTAIGNPGVEALQAAAQPKESEYWYYLHDSNKVLHPSRNEAEHEAYRRKYNVY